MTRRLAGRLVRLEGTRAEAEALAAEIDVLVDEFAAGGGDLAEVVELVRNRGEPPVSWLE